MLKFFNDCYRVSYLSMSISEFCNSSNGIETSILAKRVGDDLQSLGKGFEAVGVGTRQRVGVEHQLSRYLSFRGSATGDQEPLLHQASDDA